MSDEDSYGPVLPSHIPEKVNEHAGNCAIGPKIPKDLRNFLENNVSENSFDANLDKTIQNKPILTKKDDFEIGPLPDIIQDSKSQDDEFRAFLLRKELLEIEEEKNKHNKREEWMVALPNKQKTGSKTFQKRKFDSDHFIDESWTKIPTKDKPVEIKAKDLFLKESDFQKAKLLLDNNSDDKPHMDKPTSSSSNPQKPKSLKEIHKELKSQAKQKASGPIERVPFDREKDLKIQDLLKRKTPNQSLNTQNFLFNKFAQAKFK